MVDNLNPTSQFHPYQPPTEHLPSSSAPKSGLDGILSKLGLSREKLGSVGSSMNLDKVRGYAASKPGIALGSLAALAIGAGLMRRRMSRTV